MPRILLIDDEVENLNALKRSLGDENPNWLILIAQGEDAGIDILSKQLENKEPIDVVLTDLVMENEASGMSIIKRARKLDPFVMAILFTAKEKNLDRYAAFDLGAFDVVEKNIMGTSASKEINIKTRAAIRYREWSQKINFLGRYFDPKIFDAIDRDPSLLELSNKVISIAFWDIRGFSHLCEILKGHPTLISGFLQEYFEVGARVIFKFDGVLDKFIGDGIMALFGVLGTSAGNDQKNALSAVQAAVALRSEFEILEKKWLEKWALYVPNKIEIGLGCGIHTDEVLVGNVGTIFRDQFTALGTGVNFASRIEARSKPGQILISQPTDARVKTSVMTSHLETISDIKNIPGTFEIFSVDGR